MNTTFNSKFQAASDADKRRMIAADVILQVHSGNYEAQSKYFVPKFADESGIHCECCGIGSCLASLVQLTEGTPEATDDESTLMGYVNQREHWNSLIKYFGKPQLALIEEFFERSDKPTHEYMGIMYTERTAPYRPGDLDKAKLYFWRRNQQRVLIQIMENIVRNGKFNPIEEIEFQTKPKVTPIPNEIVEGIQSFGARRQDVLSDNQQTNQS